METIFHSKMWEHALFENMLRIALIWRQNHGFCGIIMLFGRSHFDIQIIRLGQVEMLKREQILSDFNNEVCLLSNMN